MSDTREVYAIILQKHCSGGSEKEQPAAQKQKLMLKNVSTKEKEIQLYQ